MPQKSPYDLSFKLSRSRHFADGYIPSLLDADQAEIEATIALEFAEVEPRTLPTIPVGSKLIYTRADNHKMIFGVVVVRQFLCGALPKTQVAYPAGRFVAVGGKHLVAGRVKVPSVGQQWSISAREVETLFVSRFVTDSARIDALEARVERAEAIADGAVKIIMDLCDRVARCETSAEQIGDLQAHANSQGRILQKLVGALQAQQKKSIGGA